MASTLISFTTVSNNPVNVYRATTSNIITLTAEFDTPASSISGSLNGQALTYVQQGSSAIYIAVYTVLITDPQGDVGLVLNADTVSAILPTDGLSVNIDTLPPIVSISYITSGNSLNIPHVGDVHTMTLDLNEPLLNFPHISFGVISQSKVNSKLRTHSPVFKWTQIDSLTWQATYTLTGKELLPREFTFNLVDLTGNISIITYRVIETKVLDFANKYYYFDHFINQTKGRYYQSGGGTTTSIVSPIELGECGIVRYTVTSVNEYAGYNISDNFNTFLYQSYNYFEATMRISDLSTLTPSESCVLRFGFVDQDHLDPNYGIYFESDVTNNRWQMCTALNGVRTKHSVVSPINILKQPTIWSKILKIIFDGTVAKFYIDSYLVDTQNYLVADPIGANSFPSLGVLMKKVNGVTSQEFKIDYIELYMKNQAAGDFNDDFNGDFNG